MVQLTNHASEHEFSENRSLLRIILALLEAMTRQARKDADHRGEFVREYGIWEMWWPVKGVLAGLVNLESDFREAFVDCRKSQTDMHAAKADIISWFQNYEFPEFIREETGEKAVWRLEMLRQNLLGSLEGDVRREFDPSEMGKEWVDSTHQFRPT